LNVLQNQPESDRYLFLFTELKIMQEIIKETEGIIGIRKLQNGEYRLWNEEEVQSSDLLESSKRILYFIGKKNSWRKVPWQKDISRDVGYASHNINLSLRVLKEKEMVFSLTMYEFIKFYGLEYLDYRCGCYHPPEHLSWSKHHLDRLGSRTSRTMALHERLKSPRKGRVYWIAMLEIDGMPCYAPLGLHIKVQR